ncbi:uncharacterized protein LOC123657607 [Melitaea cinxia]|uniref:uncharacterized protein LOC123657607 n=1 Tax=Melitaea cinxia TaxID=113334 RepID=UPI001E271136|nr:uncharacterized protein LOC123657607 [Melitaea cinxia]
MHLDNLLIFYQNCGGLKTKITQLKLNLLTCEYDVIILVETWLSSAVFDSEIKADSYLMFRRDRNLNLTDKKGGGGLLILVKKNINVLRRFDLEANNIEEIYLHFPCYSDLLLCACYIPPASKSTMFDRFFCKLHDVHLNGHFSNLMLIGDFNLPYLKWLSDCPSPHPVVSDTDISKLLTYTMALLNLHQFNTILNENSRTLDLVFSTSRHITVNTAEDPLLNLVPHHPPLEILHSACNREPHMSTFNDHKIKRNFFKADYELINKDLCNINWTSELATLSPELAVDKFYNLLNDIIEKHVPQTKSKPPRYPNWFSKSLISTLRRKTKVWMRWKTYGSLRDYQEFDLLRKRVKLLIRNCYNLYIENIEKSLKDNIKLFWK